jgi:hypothetical protein
MSLTANQITLVKETWAVILLDPQASGDLFYSHLFNAAPAVRPLFKTEPKAVAKINRHG